MAIDFPANPTTGQQSNGFTYDGTKWKATTTSVAPSTVSATPPPSPTVGDMWFNTNDGTLYFYYNDGNTSQWVESRAPITANGYYSPNYVINGGFDIWQRGTSFTSPADGSYIADRWAFFQNGSGFTKIVSRQIHTPGSAPVAGQESEFYLRVNQTVAGSGGTYNSFIQRIEDVRTLAGQTVTVSFWARTSTSSSLGTIYLLQNFGSGGSASVGTDLTTSVALTSNWTRYTYTATLPALTGKTIGSSSFLELGFFLPSNATFSIDVWGVQLEKGSIATTFRRNANSIQGELAACQRYYARLNLPTYVTLGTGLSRDATSSYVSIKYPVTMRAVPSSIGFSNLIVTDRTQYDLPISGTNIFNAGVDSIYWGIAHSSGATSYRPCFVTAPSTGAGYFELNAEL